MTKTKKSKLIIDIINTLSLLETAELIKDLATQFKLNLSTSSSNASKNNNISELKIQPANLVSEKTHFDVILTAFNEKQIDVKQKYAIYTALTKITGLTSKELIPYLKALPKTLKTNLPKLEAELIKTNLELLGNKVELK